MTNVLTIATVVLMSRTPSLSIGIVAAAVVVVMVTVAVVIIVVAGVVITAMVAAIVVVVAFSDDLRRSPGVPNRFRLGICAPRCLKIGTCKGRMRCLLYSSLYDRVAHNHFMSVHCFDHGLVVHVWQIISTATKPNGYVA